MSWRKPYVDQRIDFARLLNGYENYIEIINQNLPLSAIFDFEGANEDEFLMDIVNFNFSQFENGEERYFKECLWKIAEQKLKEYQRELNEKYRNCEDLSERAEIAGKLGKLALQLKNKSLEEFNVRR